MKRNKLQAFRQKLNEVNELAKQNGYQTLLLAYYPQDHKVDLAYNAGKEIYEPIGSALLKSAPFNTMMIEAGKLYNQKKNHNQIALMLN